MVNQVSSSGQCCLPYVLTLCVQTGVQDPNDEIAIYLESFRCDRSTSHQRLVPSSRPSWVFERLFPPPQEHPLLYLPFPLPLCTRR